MNLFFEDSTRTRISFEAAAKRLSADVINFSAKGSSVSKGESLKDTALTLEAMGADAVVDPPPGQRCAAHAGELGWIGGSVVNAGDGTHEHPTQALLDAFTMRRHLGSIEGRRVRWWATCCTAALRESTSCCSRRLGVDVTLVAPPTLLPVGIDTWPCETQYDFDSVLGKGRRRHDASRAARADERCVLPESPASTPVAMGWTTTAWHCCPNMPIVMHPGPMNRGHGNHGRSRRRRPFGHRRASDQRRQRADGRAVPVAGRHESAGAWET